MKRDKQLKALACLQCGKYKCVDDKVFSKQKSEWRELKTNKLPNEYSVE